MAKTMNALTQNTNADTLITAGEVVELRFRDGTRTLSLRSAKLFHLLIEHAGERACDDIEHRVLISELNFSHLESEVLIDCVRDLFGTIVELTYKDDSNELRTSSGPLLSMVDRPFDWRQGDMAKLSFRLSPTLRLVLQNSNYWAVLSRRAVLAFESRYALRLYELMCLRSGLSHKTSEIFTLEDLRRRLGVPLGKLQRWTHFKERALDAAISEVQKLCDLKITYEVQKHGRRTSGITLTWMPKGLEDTTYLAPIPSIHQSFPPHGGLKFGQNIAHWRDLAETHVKRLQGGHLPDLSELANQFRAWCVSKNLPLDASGIEKAFIGFCQKYRPPNAAD